MYNRILKLCEENNINGKKLGELLGLKKSPLTDWKNGKAKPTIEQITRMCEIFAISADYILFGKEYNELSTDEIELLRNYKLLPDIEKGRVLEYTESRAEPYKSSSEKSSESRTG